MVGLRFGKRKEEIPAAEVPLPPPMKEDVKKEEKIQIFSYYEVSTIQLLTEILEEQKKIVRMLEEASKGE